MATNGQIEYFLLNGSGWSVGYGTFEGYVSTWTTSIYRAPTSNVATVTVKAKLYTKGGDTGTTWQLMANWNTANFSSNSGGSHSPYTAYEATLTYNINVGDSGGTHNANLVVYVKNGNTGSDAYSNFYAYSLNYGSKTTYSINFNGNGATSGSVSAITKYHGTNITLPSNKYTRTGYSFSGWNTNAAGTGTTYAAGASYSGNSNITFYAKWSAQRSPITNVSNATAGTAVTVQWNVLDSSMTYKLLFTLGEWSYATETISAGTSSYSYTVPLDVCNQITTSDTGDMSVVLSTYQGSTLLGSDSKSCSISVPESIVPNAPTMTLSKVLADSFGNVYVNTSKLKATLAFNNNGLYGATIQSASIIVDGTRYQTNVGDSSQVEIMATNYLVAEVDKNVYAVVTDSRGRSSASVYSTITVYDYHAPVINSMSLSIDGNTVNVSVTGSISYVGGSNAHQIKITKRNTTTGEAESTVRALSTIASPTDTIAVNGFDHTFVANASQTVSGISTTSYEFTAYVYDSNGSVVYSRTTGVVCFSRLAGGKGAAFFGEATAEDVGRLNIHGTIKAEDAEVADITATDVQCTNVVATKVECDNIGVRSVGTHGTVGTLSAGAWETLDTITIPAGAYILKGTVVFANKNDSAYRSVYIQQGTTAPSVSSSSIDGFVQTPAINGAATLIQVVRFVQTTMSNTYYLTARSGTNDTAVTNSRFEIMRVG